MNGRNMDELVTRGELHRSLETWAGAIEHKIVDRIGAMLDRLETRLEQRFKAIDERFTAIDERFGEVRALILNTEETLIARMDSMFDAHRDVPKRLSALEDLELKPRVEKLEAAVFAPRSRSRRPR